MKELIDQLKRHEGSRTHVYECPAGYMTIGVGRNIDPNGGLGLSEDEIDYLLENDLRRCERELGRFSWFDDLDMIRQDALINMCFNLGFTRLLKFKNMLAAIAEGRYSLAAVEALDSKWAKQVGDRAKELAHQIETGTYLK
jgi:lysozyme